MYYRDRFTDVPGGNPVTTGTPVKLRTVADNALLVELATDASGFVEYTANGSPGDIYSEITHNGTTRRRYGTVGVQNSGWWEGEFPFTQRILTDGVMAGIDGALAVTPGTGLAVSVATGGAFTRGNLYVAYTAQSYPVTANSSGSTRIDSVVIELTRSGVWKGRHRIVVLAGSPSATPAPPPLTQDSTTWQHRLANVTVASGAGSFVAGNISDQRAYTAGPLPDGSVTGAKLAAGTLTHDDQLIIEQTLDGAFLVERTEGPGEDVFNVDTANKIIKLPNGVNLRTYSDNYAAQTFRLDGATGVLTLKDGGITIRTVTASPEGAVTANPGSYAFQTDGKVWRKASGAGNTGWVDTGLSSGVTSIADTASIDLTLSSGQLSAAAVFGTVAGKVAEGNHTHNGIVFLSPFRSGTTIASTTSTTGVDVLTASPTLLSGVVYDVFAIGALRVAPTSGNRGEVALAINGTTFAFIGHGDVNGGEIWNACAVAGIAGTGVSIPTSLQVRCSAGSVDYSFGRMLTVAIPRS